jgi:hypothetical protein
MAATYALKADAVALITRETTADLLSVSAEPESSRHGVPLAISTAVGATPGRIARHGLFDTPLSAETTFELVAQADGGF